MTYYLALNSYYLFILERSLLDADADALEHSVILVAIGVETFSHVHAEESPESLPESCPESTHKRLDDEIASLVSLAVDELN